MKPKIQPLANLLNKSLNKLQAQTGLFEQAYALYAEVLPTRLHGTYQIANIKSSEIVVTTTNPESRYMLTQFSHDFIRKIQKLKSFAQIDKVTIKIDTQINQINHNKTTSMGGHLAKARRPSKEAAQLMKRISEGIDDKELAAALNNLAKLAK